MRQQQRKLLTMARKIQEKVYNRGTKGESVELRVSSIDCDKYVEVGCYKRRQDGDGGLEYIFFDIWDNPTDWREEPTVEEIIAKINEFYGFTNNEKEQ